MRKKIEIATCDLCGSKNNVKEVNYPVLFTTEQTEGRIVTPYISQSKIDLCEKCINEIIIITGRGAQGHNTFEKMERRWNK